jgi:hypothetical protein
MRSTLFGLIPFLLCALGCGGNHEQDPTRDPAGSTAGTSDTLSAGGAPGTDAVAAVPAGAGAAGGTLSGSGSSSDSEGMGGAIGLVANAGSGAVAPGGGSGGAAGAGSASSDYPFCDYGEVPSGTPPAWQDAPLLTPIGINPYGAPSVTVAGGYILINEGPAGITQVPRATQSDILARINADLKFETAYSFIHLPPWSTGQTGTHYIDYLFVNSGLPRDPNAGGDSSYEGRYPNVETTSVAMTDASQRYDLTHEFNHVLENSYGTVPGQKVSWIQESYNDYLILLTAENAAGATPGQAEPFTLPPNVGYLDALVYRQPFVPIESCGIAVADASSVNGPADYFTDITGFRYNDLFPLFIAQRVSQHFFAAVWEQAKTTEQILQTMARLTDKARVQCMVEEYGARLALGDFRELSASIQRIADPAMYVATTTQNGFLVPTSTTALPRYTGRNNIPISVSAGASEVSVNFVPDAMGSSGTAADMRAQIVYRASDGAPVFSPPVASGTTSIALDRAPKNGVVIVVISNVTLDGYRSAKSYGWDPNETFGYRLQVSGGVPAPTNRKYF